jgi:hypothetical protein
MDSLVAGERMHMRERTALHEMSHACLVVHLEGQLLEVSLMHPSADGYCRYLNVNDGVGAVSIAGPIGELLFTGELPCTDVLSSWGDPKWTVEHCRHDIGRRGWPSQECRQSVAAILLDNVSAIREFSERLVLNNNLSAEDIEQFANAMASLRSRRRSPPCAPALNVPLALSRDDLFVSFHSILVHAENLTALLERARIEGIRDVQLFTQPIEQLKSAGPTLAAYCGAHLPSVNQSITKLNVCVMDMIGLPQKLNALSGDSPGLVELSVESDAAIEALRAITKEMAPAVNRQMPGLTSIRERTEISEEE